MMQDVWTQRPLSTCTLQLTKTFKLNVLHHLALFLHVLLGNDFAVHDLSKSLKGSLTDATLPHCDVYYCVERGTGH